MSKFKIGDKAIYLIDEIEVEVEILRTPQAEEKCMKDIVKSCPELYHYCPDLFKTQIIIEDRIKYVKNRTLFEKNSQEYIIAKLNKLEREINRGFFARIFNK
jgi:hypothetical protein